MRDVVIPKTTDAAYCFVRFGDPSSVQRALELGRLCIPGLFVVDFQPAFLSSDRRKREEQELRDSAPEPRHLKVHSLSLVWKGKIRRRA